MLLQSFRNFVFWEVYSCYAALFWFEWERASLEVHIWTWQASEAILHSEIKISHLVNTQNVCTNFCSQNYNWKLQVFLTPHRREILIPFPIYRHLNVENNNLWKKRRHCQWWSPGSSPFFFRLSRAYKLQCKLPPNIDITCENQRDQIKIDKRRYFTEWLENLWNVMLRQISVDALKIDKFTILLNA